MYVQRMFVNVGVKGTPKEKYGVAAIKFYYK